VKNISTSLTNFFLDNTTFGRADLISIALPNGQVMNVLDGTNVTFITYPTTFPATITVSGGVYPWSPTDPTYPFTITGGTPALSLPMKAGETLQIEYTSGFISPFFAGTNLVDPSGGGIGRGGVYGSFPPMSLIGGFANLSGFLVAPPFYIGLGGILGPAPAGTTQILMGVNDSFEFDSTGSWLLTLGAGVYYSTKYGVWERGPFSNKADFQLSTEVMKLTAFIPETVLYPGTTTPLMQVVNLGLLTTAKVVIQTLFWPLGSPPSTGFSMGTMQLMQGQIGNVKNTGRSKIVCDVYDLTYILNRPFPPHMIQSSCRHTFCDQGCTLSATTFTSSDITVDSSSTSVSMNLQVPVRLNGTIYQFGNLVNVANVIYMCNSEEGTSAGSLPTFNPIRGTITVDGTINWVSVNNGYPLGYIVYVSGQNTGLKKTVKAQGISAGLLQLQLLYPFPFPVAGGDTVKLITGCDKTLNTCENVYDNLIHFGGMPFVPNPEIAQLLLFALGLWLYLLLEMVKHFI
jgi:uncharacterized protein/uncharacterized protein DUF2163